MPIAPSLEARRELTADRSLDASGMVACQGQLDQGMDWVSKLEAAPLCLKTVTHLPYGKVCEFLVDVLGALTYLRILGGFLAKFKAYHKQH